MLLLECSDSNQVLQQPRFLYYVTLSGVFQLMSCPLLLLLLGCQGGPCSSRPPKSVHQRVKSTTSFLLGGCKMLWALLLPRHRFAHRTQWSQRLHKQNITSIHLEVFLVELVKTALFGRISFAQLCQFFGIICSASNCPLCSAQRVENCIDAILILCMRAW